MTESRCHLFLPEQHPFNEMMADALHERKFLSVDDFKLKGSYYYHYTYSDEFVDTITTDIKVKRPFGASRFQLPYDRRCAHMHTSPCQQIVGGDLNLFGHVIRYVLAFKNNIFGAHSEFISSENFKKAGCRNRIAYEQSKRFYSVWRTHLLSSVSILLVDYLRYLEGSS
jgi:hypothetical protein